jgi:succinate-semialdehyde dehydrogenase/glutarate-semialdehyde dehydrogenase
MTGLYLQPAVPSNSYRCDLFVGGEWTPGSSSERFPVTDPSDMTAIAHFAIATPDDCAAAVDAAAAALPMWSATPPRERSEILRRTFDILVSQQARLTEIIVRENGKSWADARAEATYATEFFRWFAEEAVRVRGDHRLSPDGGKYITVTHQPVGVAILITPWNFPAAMAARKLAPALAAGCTVVLKPATETPLTSGFIVEALVRAGVPAGVVNLVTPIPAAAGVDRMLRHPAVRKVSFTGSTEVGRIVLARAAESVLSASMELGGNAPLIVLPGADLDAAVDGTLVAKMRNGGSACTSANRLYVHRPLHDEFVERFADQLSGMTTGPGLDRSNSLGSCVSLKERDKIASLVNGAVADGARIVIGGTTPSGPGAFYPPTLLTGVVHGSAITTTEIFGPVATVIPYDDVDEAIAMANDTTFGLIAYVFGAEGEAMAVARRLDAGMVGINRGSLSDPAAPFGGMKQSGLGREGSDEGIKEFLELKYIASPA